MKNYLLISTLLLVSSQSFAMAIYNFRNVDAWLTDRYIKAEIVGLDSFDIENPVGT